jgi:hypothetical protein
VRNRIVYLAALSFLCVARLNGRALQTPLPFEAHFREQLYTVFNPIDSPWHIDALVGGYQRWADTAFSAQCDPCSRSPGALAALFFNEGCFTAQQAFAPNSGQSPLDPFLNDLLCPRIKYTDSGAVLIVSADYAVNDCWDIGLRAQLPIRKISVKRLHSPGTGSSIFGGNTIADVAIFDTETVDGATVDSFAFRLDFLSKLPIDCKQPGLSLPFVNYNNSAFPQTPITFFNLDMTDNPNLDNLPLGPDNRNAITVLQSNGIPPEPFGVDQALVQGLPALSANGTSLGLNQRARFILANNYTPLGANPGTQSQMWIVPTVDVPDDTLVSRAEIIRTQVARLLTCINPSAESLFTQCAGTSFDCQEQNGTGDLDIDFFARYIFCHEFLMEGFLGVRCPTGKQTQASTIFFLPLGNNGHTELKVGGHVRWNPIDWFIFNADALFSHALKHNESVAASFRGALVKNLGPTLCANIWWNYVQAHMDATWYFVQNSCWELSWHLGYEVYAKFKDHVCFGISSTTDCVGNVEPLDPSVLEQNTNGLSHKVYGDLCVGCYPLSCMAFRFFGGFNTVVAGQSMPKEHGYHLGALLSFDF